MKKQKKIPALGAAVIICLITGIAVSLTSGCAGKPKLYVYNWTYYTPPSVIEKFEAEYGVKVIYDEFASNEEMFTKLQAGASGYDIIFPSGDYVSIMIELGLLEQIDKSLIPNLGNISPEVLEKTTFDPDMNYSVPYYWGAAGILVNTAKVPVYEKSWSIFARTDLKGRMTMLDDMREILGNALAYLGYSVNTKDPVQLAEARDLVNNSWKPNLVKFDAEAFGKGYAQGDFWVVHGYPEVVYDEIEGDEELRRNTVFFIPPEGGSAYIDYMCILKGAKNIDLAHKFIDFIHRPEIYAEFADYFDFPASANSKAGVHKNKPPMYTVEEILNTELKNDLGEELEMYNAAWETIKMGF
ncbi:MAG: extracellular solute-binding protein [Treponema sp.]|nr:extracellular solute-binding protein [Treponema sp.]